jgi:RNA polymerase sigma-70 factor (ECF subfamily)
MSNRQERALLELARGGDEAAFTELVRLHQAAVRAYLGRHSRDRELVDDLAQDAFVTAFRRLDAFRGESSLRLWLLGIARNLWRTHLRGELRRREREEKRLSLELARWRSERVVEERLEAVDRELGALECCLQRLGQRNRTLVEAHYFQGETAAEIARGSGRKASAVRMTLLRVRRGLRACVEKQVALGGA